MKEYELLTVIKPNMDADEVSKITDKFDELIISYGGKILNSDKIGRKKLSYEIDKFRDGFYVVQRIELNEDKVADLKRQLKLNENILRSMILIADKVGAGA